MPVYQYEGVHYELPDGLSNDQAMQKIKGHLGQASTDKAGEQSMGLLGGAADLVGGIAETATTGALDAFGGIGATAYGSIKGALTDGKTASQGRDEALEAYGNSTFSKLMAPQTKTGKYIGDQIGHAVEGWKDWAPDTASNLVGAIPFIGDQLNAQHPEVANAVGAVGSAFPEAAMLAPLKGLGKKGAAKPTPKAKGPDAASLVAKLEQETSSSSADRPQQLALPESIVMTKDGQGVLSPQDAMFKKIAEERAARVQAAKPVEGRDLADPFGQMKQQLDTPQNIPNESSVMAALVKGLQEHPMTAAEIQKAGSADKAIALRQAALEQEVKQRQGLDFNAAERTRQEQAPSGFTEHQQGITGDRAIGATAEGLQSPATAAQRGIRAEEPVARQGQETLYTDPAGQTFRGNPADPMAVEALARQKEAARNNLEHNIATKKGQPMDLLTVENMRKANEGPQLPWGEEALQHQMKAELASRAIEEHPFVQKAAERITKQEELITKLAGQVKEGKATASKLARAVKDLENFEASFERTKLNVAKGVSDGTKPTPFGNKQRGAINPEVFADGFRKLIKKGDVEYQMYSRPNENAALRSVVVEAKSKGKKIGEYSFGPKGENLYAWGAETIPEMRRKGVASGAYEALRSLGNDIVPSTRQTTHGKALWKGMSNKQRGAVNPKVFEEGFEKLKQLADGTWLKAKGDGATLTVEAWKDGHKVGDTTFDGKYTDRLTSDNRNLEAFSTNVKTEHQGKGIASDMYKFASELGNDIQPSDIQSAQGKAMWKGFEKKGMVKDGLIPKKDGTINSPGNKQKGAVMIDPGQGPEGKFLSEHPALKLPGIVPMKLTAERVVELAKTAPDVEQNALQKIANYGTKGGLYQALKTNNPLVKFTHEKVTDADRLSRGEIQDYVHDRLAPASRDLSANEKAQVWAVVDMADRMQREVTPAMLAEHGFNEKQINWVTTHREVMDFAFERLNGALAELGKKPISRRISYAAMSASGDFRKLVHKLDANGEKVVVGVIGSDNKYVLNKRAKALEEQGYVMGEEKYYGGVPHQKGSAHQAFVEALEVLAEKDPRVEDFLKVLDDVSKQEAYSFLNVKKHTLNKKGIFGMEGRKPWETAEANAKEGMQAQVAYAEQAIKMGHIVKAAKEIRDVINNPDINMPNAKQWSEGYLQNAMGFNPSQMGRSLEHGVAAGMRPTGFGYSYLRDTAAISRKAANTILLGLNPGFWMTNIVQPMASMPGMKAYLISKGLKADFDFGTGYSYLFKGSAMAMREKGNVHTAFEHAAYEYAKKNHVYGSDLIEHSNRVSKDAPYALEKVGNVASGAIESVSRRVMFFSMAHLLKENGLSIKNGLFEAAHNLTDMAMNNYSPIERPKFYNSLGPIGELATNLSSFKHNEFSRLALFARQIKEEKSMRPLGIQLATGVAMAGLTGTIAFQEADWLYKQISKAVGKPDSLTLLAIRLSEKAPVGDNKYALSHGGFSFLGLDMSKRLGLSDAIPNSVGEFAFPGGSKLADIGGAALDATKQPTEMNAKRLAREAAPAGATGVMDRAWFSKDTKNGELALNRKNLEAQVYRNQADKTWKSLGMTGVNESVQKAKLYEVDNIKQAYTDLRTGPLNAARDELFSTGHVSPQTIQKYLKYEGDISTLVADLSRLQTKMNIPAKDLEMLRSTMSKSITSLKHAQRLKEAYGN